jgi:hypothetical protein
MFDMDGMRNAFKSTMIHVKYILHTGTINTHIF